MKATVSFLVLLGAAWFGAGPASAQYLWVDCSFKAVLSPADGLRFYSFTETNVDATISEVNRWLATYQRGYRFRRAGPIQNVGGLGDCTGPGKWYNVNLRTNGWSGTCGSWSNSWINHRQMELEARYSNSVAYAWSTNAVNFYIVAGYGTTEYSNSVARGVPAGDGAFYGNDGWLVTLGTVDSAPVLLHETGHHFELYHTQGGCDCKKQNAGCTLTNGYNVGWDDLADTLADSECLTSNTMALANFNKPYANCTPAEQALVTDTFFNLMSYHMPAWPPYPEVRTTELQWDKWTDYANSGRAREVSGKTRFVSLLGNDANSGLSSVAPKRTVLNAVANSVAAGGDIVLLRPGNYNEQITLNQPVTLRATRTGWATIGH